MSDGIKLRKHAPYRKSYLIPIWAIQLGLSTFLVILSGISIAIDQHRDSPDDYQQPGFNSRVLVTFDVIHLLLNAALIASIIYIIIKFSAFKLTTKIFKVQSIFAVVVGAICIILYCTPEGGDFIMATFPGAAWLASMAICVRVCLLRRRVKRGEVGEMKRERVVEERVSVELQDGNKFRVVEEVGKAGPCVKVALGDGERNGKPRPSFNSDGTGILSAPEKVAREFV